MDQCTLGALRTRSDRDLVGPKISITVRTPLIDPPRSTKEARMEQEQGKDRPPPRWAGPRRSTCGRGYRRRSTTGTRPRKARAISTRKRVRGAGRAAGKRPGNRVQLRRPGRTNRRQGRSDMVRRRRRLRGAGTFRREQSRSLNSTMTKRGRLMFGPLAASRR